MKRALDGWSLPGGAPGRGNAELGSAQAGGIADLVIRFPLLESAGTEELLARLHGAWQEVLWARRAEELPEVLGRVGNRFLDPEDSLRREALEWLPASARISPEMAREVLDGMARDWTPERLRLLLRSEFPDPSVLDAFRPADPAGRRMAVGPPVQLHLGSGNVPGVTTTSLIRGLMVKSAVLVKPGSGDLILPLLFRRGLEEEDEKLARALAVLYWPGGGPETEAMESGLLSGVRLVVVYGGDDTVATVGRRLAPGARLVAYPHRWSVAAVARELLSPEHRRRSAEAAARAVALFEQRGCVSPQAILVEEGGRGSAREWARELSYRLDELRETLPPPPSELREAAWVQQVRGAAALQASAGGGGELLEGPGVSWTVFYDPGPVRAEGCLGRTIRVHPVSELDGLISHLTPFLPQLQTVALEAPEGRRGELARLLARGGALRITTLEEMPWPPAWWRHDGAGPLAALIRWVDLEGEGPAGG